MSGSPEPLSSHRPGTGSTGYCTILRADTPAVNVTSVCVRLNKPVTGSARCLGVACDDCMGRLDSTHAVAYSALPIMAKKTTRCALPISACLMRWHRRTGLPLLKGCKPLRTLPYIAVALDLSSTAQNVAYGSAVP
jgi:hypothetical protein